MSSKKLSKKDDAKRKWGSFVKHSLMLVRPVLITCTVDVLWWWMWSLGISFPKHGPNEMIITVVLVVVVPFGILAAEAIRTAWNKNEQIIDSILPKDEHKFMRYRDEKILIPVHIMLIAFASMTVLLVGLFHYLDAWVGLVLVSVTTFSFSLVWSIIRELEDPRRSQWVRERVPRQWFEADVDEFFSLGKEDHPVQ
jgi:hypothetical protein